MRIFALLCLTAIFSLSVGLALNSLWVSFLLMSFLVAGQLLLAIWQENSLLLRAGTALELGAHQAAQLAAIEERVRNWSQMLSLGTPPLVYWRSSPSKGAYLIRSLGSSGVLILDQGLFAQMNDRDWDRWIHDALLTLGRPETVLRSFAQWWLGVIAPNSWQARTEGWTALRAFGWILASPIRNFFVWFQL